MCVTHPHRSERHNVVYAQRSRNDTAATRYTHEGRQPNTVATRSLCYSALPFFFKNETITNVTPPIDGSTAMSTNGPIQLSIVRWFAISHDK